MKYFKFEDYKKKNETNLNKKKVILTTSIILLLVIIIISFAAYISNVNFRNFLDTYIFRKNITQDNVVSIDINSEDSGHVYAYDKYITVLNKNVLKTYSNSGKKEFESEVTISNPIFDSNNRFLCIAENSGHKLYLISGQNILWQKDLEGNISKVNVNKNGYVSVIVSGTTHKTVVITFNSNGKELFSSFLASTIAIDSDISTDNKYLAIAEIDTSGSLVQSNIKILSIEKAQTDSSNAVEYIYPASSKSIAINIKYQDKNKLVCMYDDSIHIIQNNSDSEFLNLSDKKISFTDIGLKDNVVKIVEKSSGLFADTQVQITNIDSKKENIYTIKGVPKDIHAYENAIAVNLGTEVHFINCNGWLIKKYNSTQEVKDIVIGSSIAGIIYRDKIEIINL